MYASPWPMMSSVQQKRFKKPVTGAAPDTAEIKGLRMDRLNTPTRRAACLGLGAAALATSIRPMRAQAWPSRPVTVVVPYAAGGNTDLMARLAAKYLSE